MAAVKPFAPCSDEEYFNRLVTEAPYVEGWHTNTETLADIEWLDREKLAKAKDFFYKHRFTLSASTGIAALFGVPFKNVTLPFMQTGTISVSREKTVKRTVKHVTHFVEWYSRGVTEDWVYNDIQKIKKMHTFLSKTIKPYEPPADDTIPNPVKHQRFKEALEKDIAEMKLENAFAGINRYDPEIYFSQFDMVIIQLDFMAAFIRPDLHMIEDPSGMDAFLHHWAVVGRLLGIQDRFNLALHPSLELHLRIFRNLCSCMLTMDLTLSRLLESHLEGVALYFHSSASSAAVMYAYTKCALPGFKGNHLYKLFSFRDKVELVGFMALTQLLSYSNIAKTFVRYTGTKIYSLTSSGFHKLSREDKLKLPAEFIV